MVSKRNNSKYIALKKHWGYDNFRPQQEEIIDHVLNQNDVLALLPTGGGKSLCYQLPALILDGLCIVISPLIALMKDQVEQLCQKNIAAEYINSSLSAKEIDRILDNCIYGKIKLLYISPERIQTPLFKERFKKMKISFIAVDEAHCISQWGYDFRAQYLNIAMLKEWDDTLKFIALTATATNQVIKDIQEKLLFSKKNVVRKSFQRINLHYNIIPCINKLKVLKRVVNNECTIIYARTRIKAEQIAFYLTKEGFSAEFYHAGMPNKQRSIKQQNWINNDFNIIVATSAFGMGIDKPDVRSVIHYDIPECIESFYQESGRAGRDGKPAYSTLLYEHKDKITLLERIKSKHPDLSTIKKIYQQFCNLHQIPIGYISTNKYEVDIEELANKTSSAKNVVYYTFKHLTQAGHLLENNNSNYISKVKFTANIQSINSFAEHNPKLEKTIDLLIRSYDQILNKEVAISEKTLAKRSNLLIDDLIKNLEELKKFQIINYIPKIKSYQVQFNIPRCDINKMKIQNSKKIIKEREIQMAQSMIFLIKDISICRNISMLSYFNETLEKPCNRCDNCERNIKQTNNPTKIISNAIIMSITYEAKDPKSIYNELNDIINEKDIKENMKQLLEENIIYLDSNNQFNLK